MVNEWSESDAQDGLSNEAPLDVPDRDEARELWQLHRQADSERGTEGPPVDVGPDVIAARAAVEAAYAGAETRALDDPEQTADAGGDAYRRAGAHADAEREAVEEDCERPERPITSVLTEGDASDTAVEPIFMPVDLADIDSRTSVNRINLADNVPDVMLVPTYDGYLDVVMHGDATGTQANIDYEPVDFTLDQTATMIAASPSWEGRPLRLMSCSTAEADYAQQLADRLGTVVYAPDGVLSVAGGVKEVLFGGKWRRFEPHDAAGMRRDIERDE
jgi:hypothetical protein